MKTRFKTNLRSDSLLLCLLIKSLLLHHNIQPMDFWRADLGFVSIIIYITACIIVFIVCLFNCLHDFMQMSVEQLYDCLFYYMYIVII